MKTTIKPIVVFIFFTLMLLNTYSCIEKPRPPKPPEKEIPIVIPPNDKPPTPTKADLTILNAKLEKLKDPGEWYTHLLIVTIRNNGDTAARGFHCGCSYNCLNGLTNNAGVDVVQGGYIAANSEHKYKVRFHIYCAGPPAFLDLNFDVDIKNKVIESNEKNNKERIRVAVPF